MNMAALLPMNEWLSFYNYVHVQSVFWINEVWNPSSHKIDGRVINENENNTKLERKNIPVNGRPRISSKCVDLKTHAQFKVLDNNDSHWLLVLNNFLKIYFNNTLTQHSMTNYCLYTEYWDMFCKKVSNLEFVNS